MSHTTPSESVTSAISSLKINTAPASLSTKSTIKPKNQKVADSWDDDVSDGSATETEPDGVLSPSLSNVSSASTSLKPTASNTPPNPPPPTPASPTAAPFGLPDAPPYSYAYEGDEGRERSRSGSGAASPARRPEKTTAVAGRLIAAGLGVRAPRRTEEEREYDRVMREKERKRRDEERDRKRREEAERERRVKAAWDD
ncbi:hypothetical protein BU16DRAFT_551005 [Lophium mytilinum]|uniref:Uncharacterized protein n=1 Tax=Lophium mytilinum TaxID=390894 RepID=A0A6A6QPU9_9PEZI|nr:hypothetical protein BU16DRAFT_551005 [Lophium mytilinum]